MGSKLTRQRSLDFDSKLSKRRRQRNEIPGESERSSGRSGGDFLFTSLMLKSDKLPGMLRKTNHSPYVRRVAWVREIQRLLREQKMEQAAEVLKVLRKVRKWPYFNHACADCGDLGWVRYFILTVLQTLQLKEEAWQRFPFINVFLLSSSPFKSLENEFCVQQPACAWTIHRCISEIHHLTCFILHVCHTWPQLTAFTD